MADLKTLMEDIARAIRLKTGTNEKINAQDFPQKIREIETGGAGNSNYDLKEWIEGTKDVLLITEGKILKSMFYPVKSSLDWTRKIIFSSPYVDFKGQKYIMGSEKDIVLPFQLWHNCELVDFHIYQNGEELSNIEYEYYINDKNINCLNLFLNKIEFDTTVEINVSYTEDPIPLTQLAYCDVVDYIETSSNKNTYINTNITPKKGLKVTYIGNLLDTRAQQAFFGSQNNGSQRLALYYYRDYSDSLYFYLGSSDYPYIDARPMTTKRTYVMDSYNLYVDGVLKKSSTCNDFTSVYPIYLFAWNNRNTAKNLAYAKCYGFSIEENDEKLIDLIPVYDRRSSRYGLYDYVTDEIFFGIGGELLGGYDE